MSFTHARKELANWQALVDIGVSRLIGCYTLSIQKSWMKKRLNLTLSASNFLKKYKTFDYQATDTYFEAANWSKSVAQRFAVTVSFRIGELKASVRKAERSISNDDVKSGGGNSGGGEK